jgi:predicted nuclease of predicted toxin-antitoxin system
MKLLLDENLSRRIVPFLQEAYPDSTQVALIALEAATDLTIWEFAKANNFVIVTRDADFLDLSLVKGQPPKIIRLRTANQTRAKLLSVLLVNQAVIEESLLKNDEACIEILDAKDNSFLY